MPFCEKEFGSEESVVIGKKGADGINNASDKRGDNIIVAQVMPCKLYQPKLHRPSVVKRIAHVSVGPYDSSTDCLYCGNKVAKFEFGVKNDDYGCVKTDCFADTIL
jgi:hypothetical protein